MCNDKEPGLLHFAGSFKQSFVKTEFVGRKLRKYLKFLL